MVLQRVMLGYVVVGEVLASLLLTFPWSRILKMHLVATLSSLLQPTMGIVPFAIFQLLGLTILQKTRFVLVVNRFFVASSSMATCLSTMKTLGIAWLSATMWCFSCDAYLDAQVIAQLRPSYETGHLLKFRVEPPHRFDGNGIEMNF